MAESLVAANRIRSNPYKDYALLERTLERLGATKIEGVTTVALGEEAPPRRFAFRWHPFAIDPAVDYSAEPMTLGEFTLSEAAGGTALVIRESGFDRIPLERRAKAFTANDGGWAAQLDLITKYLDKR